MDWREIPFSPPDISGQEVLEVTRTLQSGWITTGPRTKQLEKELAEFIGTNRVVCLNSATAAEELNLRILGIGEGDEVLVPAYTYTATASAAIHTGATIKLIDCRPDSCEMDYDQMEAAITEKTKAVIPVDIGGVVCDYHRIYQAVERKRSMFVPSGNTNLGKKIQKALGRAAVISDCAHSLGSKKGGVMAGAIADFSSFSFHAVKNFTTAEGGASTWKEIDGIDSGEIYRQYQLYSLHGQDKDALEKTRLGTWEYDIIAPWYKCNMTDIMAAIGLKQLERYPDMIKRRKEMIHKYDRMCDKLGIKYLVHKDKETEMESCVHLYITRIPWAEHGQRCEIIAEMAKRGIACNVHYKPLPMMTAYQKMDRGDGRGWEIRDFPNAYHYYKNEITLPLHTKLDDDDVEYIIKNFQEVVAGSR